MEGYARYRLGQAKRLNRDYAAAEEQFKEALALLTLDEAKDWSTIVKVNNEMAATLFAQGKDDEAKTILTRIATIEETMRDD
jgi:tetratricopeptide (TPR) repeat protein